jgi:hypothetical protein
LVMALVAPLIHTLAHMAEPWRSVYSDSKVLETAVLFAHLGALLLGGGLAVAADRAVLRLRHVGPAPRYSHLEELHAVHRPVIIALVVLFMSGVLMGLADVETFATSPFFWVKMSLVTLLVVNGGVLYSTETALRQMGTTRESVPAQREGVLAIDQRREDALWRRLWGTAIASLLLWTATVLAGVALVNAA